MMRTASRLLLLVFPVSAAFAQMTLEQVVQDASTKYPAVRASLEQVSAAASAVNVARTAYLPRADFGAQLNRATHNNIFGLLLPQGGIYPSISGPVLGTNSLDSVLGDGTRVAGTVGTFRLRVAEGRCAGGRGIAGSGKCGSGGDTAGCGNGSSGNPACAGGRGGRGGLRRIVAGVGNSAGADLRRAGQAAGDARPRPQCPRSRRRPPTRPSWRARRPWRRFASAKGFSIAPGTRGSTWKGRCMRAGPASRRMARRAGLSLAVGQGDINAFVHPTR